MGRGQASHSCAASVGIRALPRGHGRSSIATELERLGPPARIADRAAALAVLSRATDRQLDTHAAICADYLRAVMAHEQAIRTFDDRLVVLRVAAALRRETDLGTVCEHRLRDTADGVRATLVEEAGTRLEGHVAALCALRNGLDLSTDILITPERSVWHLGSSADPARTLCGVSVSPERRTQRLGAVALCRRCRDCGRAAARATMTPSAVVREAAALIDEGLVRRLLERAHPTAEAARTAITPMIGTALARLWVQHEARQCPGPARLTVQRCTEALRAV